MNTRNISRVDRLQKRGQRRGGKKKQKKRLESTTIVRTPLLREQNNIRTPTRKSWILKQTKKKKSEKGVGQGTQGVEGYRKAHFKGKKRA